MVSRRSLVTFASPAAVTGTTQVVRYG